VWPVSGAETVAVAAGLEGCYATADELEDKVEIRDIDANLRRTIMRDDIAAILPSFGLPGGTDGIAGLTFSDSCRSLFILIHTDTRPETNAAQNVILRYDTWDDVLNAFASLDMSNRNGSQSYIGAVHSAGRLYVGAADDGIAVYQAGANDTTGVLLGRQALPSGSGAVRSLAIHRSNDSKVLYVATLTALFRAPLGELPWAFTAVGTFALSDVQSMTYTSHYGAPGQEGLYVVASDSDQVWYVSETQALGQALFEPVPYAMVSGAKNIAATADGGLLLAAGKETIFLRDDADPRLGFWPFVTDEFQQAVRFAKSLISPDGEPSGWVIDANVSLGSRRFHPASPDAAAWVVLMLLMSDRIDGDLASQGLIRTILSRYAGLADDGIRPERTVDGMYRHWYEPSNGKVKVGWDPEWAILSTMKIVLAAARAQHYYSNDSMLQEAASRIIDSIRGWSNYLMEPPGCQVYFRGHASGGPTGSATSPFNEAILFVDQVRHFDDSAKAVACFEAWLDRSRWPAVEFVEGRPLTGRVVSPILPVVNFKPAFITQYAFLLQPDFRSSPGWQVEIENLHVSSAAWTDDNDALFVSVFSAGTTKAGWSPSGYAADHLGSHAGNIAHFPALLAFASQGDTGPAVAAYHAYRHGARQIFEPGAASDGAPELLYRRSNMDPAYEANSAGVPDVIYGALGLAGLLDPGAIDEVLVIPYE
jgi:hypothetical protein